MPRRDESPAGSNAAASHRVAAASPVCRPFVATASGHGAWSVPPRFSSPVQAKTRLRGPPSSRRALARAASTGGLPGTATVLVFRPRAVSRSKSNSILGALSPEGKIGSVASKDRDFRNISLKMFAFEKYHRKIQMLLETTNTLDLPCSCVNLDQNNLLSPRRLDLVTLLCRRHLLQPLPLLGAAAVDAPRPRAEQPIF